ncbi:MAG: cation:proton antiporter, partial [Proteobacteria bacterium]|nr:cation:proton antiporter [Pseudomonadota bacterium]
MILNFSAPELFLVLLVVTITIALIAQKASLPTPIAMVVGGMALGSIPGAPSVPLDPEYVFILFLPLLLMEAAYYTSLRDFKSNMRPISQLAIGLVLATTFAAAAILKWLIPSISWAAAIAFGAIISPPDAVAATAITRRLKVPKRIITILSGESLVNDATGLVVYKFAVLAVVAGSFSMLSASISFVWVVIVGSLVGYFTTVLYLRLYPYIKDHTI